MHLLEIQGNSEYSKQHGDSNCKSCYIFVLIDTNRNFTKKNYLRNIGFLIIIISFWVTESQQGM